MTGEWTRAITAGSDSVCEYRFLRGDGSISWVESHAAALHNDAGQAVGWVGTCLDLTDRKAAEAAVVAASERFRVAFDNAPIGMGLVTPERHLAPGQRRLLPPARLQRARAAGAEPRRPDGARRRDGSGRRGGGAAARDPLPRAPTAPRSGSPPRRPSSAASQGEPLYYVLQVEDIGDRKQTERELRRLADHDSLTGLLNRRGFMEGLRRELRRMERKGEYGALLLLDLDNFKLVNDTGGHLVGDQVLCATADVLRRRLRATDVIGRLGGDEFAALVLNVTPRQASEIAAETTETLRAMTVTAGQLTVEVGSLDRRRRDRRAARARTRRTCSPRPTARCTASRACAARPPERGRCRPARARRRRRRARLAVAARPRARELPPRRPARLGAAGRPREPPAAVGQGPRRRLPASCSARRSATCPS